MVDGDADQELSVIDFAAKTERQGDDPPTLLLMLQVRHEEANTEWIQQLRFTRERWVSILRLLGFAADNEGLPWR